MNNAAFTCPCCGNKLELRQTLYLGHNPNLKCKRCMAILRPNLMQSRLVSSILGGITGGLGYGIGAYFMRNYGLPEGILASISFGLLAIVPSMLAVSNFVELEIKEKSNDGYKIRLENTSENYLIAKNWEFNPDLSKQEERTIYKNSPSEQNFKVD